MVQPAAADDQLLIFQKNILICTCGIKNCWLINNFLFRAVHQLLQAYVIPQLLQCLLQPFQQRRHFHLRIAITQRLYRQITFISR